MSNYQAEHLARALQIIAKCDNYMVGLVKPHDYTPDTYDEAFQILVTAQNQTPETDEDYTMLELALDLCEMYRKQAKVETLT